MSRQQPTNDPSAGKKALRASRSRPSSRETFNPLQSPACLLTPDRLTDSTWHEHIPFAFACMSILKPRVLVELGTYKGDSFFAFCQAVEKLDLPTRCHAVDTWQGDEHSSFYGKDVFSSVHSHHERHYGRFSRLIRSTFDQARAHFSEGSIDLLHIDGLHTYEAVKHDFETWLPTMSDRGVILFHDTTVRERDFGVWRLWQEVAGKYPSFEFSHGHGLGVLAVGPKVDEEFLALTALEGDARRTFDILFHCLGQRVANLARLRKRGRFGLDAVRSVGSAIAGRVLSALRTDRKPMIPEQ